VASVTIVEAVAAIEASAGAKMGRDVIFLDERDDKVFGEAMGYSADTWCIGQFHGQPRYTVRRLSRSRGRPAWQVIFRTCCDDGNACYDAVALGLTDRAKAIQLVIGRRGAMPPPLSAEQRRAIPCVVTSECPHRAVAV
jgi:hypothetical protein